MCVFNDVGPGWFSGVASCKLGNWAYFDIWNHIWLGQDP